MGVFRRIAVAQQFGPAPAGFTFTKDASYLRKFALGAELRLASR